MKIQRHGFMGWLCLMAMFVLVGCGKDAPDNSREIQFGQEAFPDFVAEVKGMSAREDWGRWSDADVGPAIVIRFKEALPKSFTLTLVAQANLHNENPKLRIGSFEQELFIQKIGEKVIVPVELKEPVDTIELIPPQPMTPKELGVNEDVRKLGVGLFSLKIEY